MDLVVVVVKKSFFLYARNGHTHFLTDTWHTLSITYACLTASLRDMEAAVAPLSVF